MARVKAEKPRRIRVTLQRSTIGRLAAHKACVIGLGLRRIGHSAVLVETPEVLGMIRRVAYLLKVEEA